MNLLCAASFVLALCGPAISFTLVVPRSACAAEKAVGTASQAPSDDELAGAERNAAQHPDDADALAALATLRLQQGDETAATDLLRHAIELSPNHPAANLALGEILLRRDHLPEAMDRFETVLAISRNPAARAGEVTAVTRLALRADQAGNKAAAYRCLDHAAHYVPDNAELLTDLGLVAERLHLAEHARSSLRQALALEPHRPSALYALGRVELDAGRLTDAERYLRAYLAEKPDDATARFGLGRALHMQQRDADAERELRRSIELQPVQTESYYELGAIALDAHRDNEAKPLFQKTLSRSPQHGGALTGMGEMSYRAHDFAAAKQSLTAAVASAPDYQPAHYYLGLTLARLGEKQASAAELARATELTRQQQGKANPVAPEIVPGDRTATPQP